LPTQFDRYPSPVYRTERPPLFIILRACRGSSATAETCPDSSAVGLSSSRLTEIYYIIVYNNITRRHSIRRPYSEPLPWWAKNYKSSAVAEVTDRGHNRHGPKRGSFVGELGPRLTQCGLGRGLLLYQVAFSSIQPFGHNRYGPKIGRLCPF